MRYFYERKKEAIPYDGDICSGPWRLAGGWCWRKVIPLLRGVGHEVYAPTLTGLGERRHLLSSRIDLATHIQDILNLLEYEDLSGVTLVGHSYGGMVISGVADQAGTRMARLVYLDAAIPAAGQSMMDVLPDRGERVKQSLFASENGPLVSPPTLSRFGVIEPEDVAWMEPRLGPQPLATFEQPVSLRAGVAKTLPCSFIWNTRFPTFSQMAQQAKAAGWDYHELEAGHDSMVSAPGALARALLACAAAD